MSTKSGNPPSQGPTSGQPTPADTPTSPTSAGKEFNDTVTASNVSSDARVTSPSRDSRQSKPVSPGSGGGNVKDKFKRIRQVAILNTTKGEAFMTSTELESRDERKAAMKKKKAAAKAAKEELDIAGQIPAAAAKKEAEAAAKKHPLYFQSVQMVMCPVVPVGATKMTTRDYPYNRSFENMLTSAVARETPQMQTKINREEVHAFLETEECRQMMISFFWIVLINQRAQLPPPASTATAIPPGMNALLVDDEAEAKLRAEELARFYEAREAEKLQAKNLYHILAFNYGTAFSRLGCKVSGYEMETKDTVFGLFNALCCHVTFYACTNCFPYDDEGDMFNRKFRRDMLQRLTFWSSGVQMQRVETGHWPRHEKMRYVPGGSTNSEMGANSMVMEGSMSGSMNWQPPQQNNSSQRRGSKTGQLWPPRTSSRGSSAGVKRTKSSVKREVSTLLSKESFRIKKKEKEAIDAAAKAKASNAADTFNAADLSRQLGRDTGRKGPKHIVPTIRDAEAGAVWYESGKLLGHLSRERLYEFGMDAGTENSKLEQKIKSGTVVKLGNTSEALPELVTLRSRRKSLPQNTNPDGTVNPISKDRREDTFVKEIILPGHSPLMYYYSTVVLQMDPEPRAATRYKDLKCTVLSELDVTAARLNFSSHAKSAVAHGQAAIASHKAEEAMRIQRECNDQVALKRTQTIAARRADYACQLIAVAYSSRSIPRVALEDKTELMLNEALKEAKGDIPEIVADYEEAVLQFREAVTELSSKKRQELSKLCMMCKVRLLALKRRAPHLFTSGTGGPVEEVLYVMEPTRRMAIPRETDGILSPEIGKIKYHVDKDFQASLRTKNMSLAKLEADVVAEFKQNMRSQGQKPFHEHKALYALEATEHFPVLREADPDEEAGNTSVMVERCKYYVRKDFGAQLREGGISLPKLEALVAADYKCCQRAQALANVVLDSTDLFSLLSTRKLHVKRETRADLDPTLGKITFYVGEQFLDDLKSKRLPLHKLEAEVVAEYKHQKEAQRLSRELTGMLGRINEEEKVDPLLSAGEYQLAASLLQEKKKKAQRAERKGVSAHLRALTTFTGLHNSVLTRSARSMSRTRNDSLQRSLLGIPDLSASTGKSYVQLLRTAQAVEERKKVKTKLSQDMTNLILNTVNLSNQKNNGVVVSSADVRNEIESAAASLRRGSSYRRGSRSVKMVVPLSSTVVSGGGGDFFDSDDDYEDAGGEGGGEPRDRSPSLTDEKMALILNLPEVPQAQKKKQVTTQRMPTTLKSNPRGQQPADHLKNGGAAGDNNKESNTMGDSRSRPPAIPSFTRQMSPLGGNILSVPSGSGTRLQVNHKERPISSAAPPVRMRKPDRDSESFMELSGKYQNNLSLNQQREKELQDSQPQPQQHANTARPPRPPGSLDKADREQLYGAMSARLRGSATPGTGRTTPQQTVVDAARPITPADTPDDPMHYPTPPQSRGSQGSRGGDIDESRHIAGIPLAAAGSAGASIPLVVSGGGDGRESPAAGARRRYSTKLSSTKCMRQNNAPKSIVKVNMDMKSD